MREERENTNRLYDVMNNFECYQCPLESECQKNINDNNGNTNKSFCNVLRLKIMRR